MQKKYFALLAILLLSISSPTYAKNRLVISGGDNALAGKFDPTVGYGVWEPDIYHCHLITVGKDNRLVKDLAEDFSITPDGLLYTFTIRQDAKFGDGHPITAKDVAFTFKTAKEKASAVDLTMLDKIEVIGDYTVRFSLKKPWSLFMHIVSYLGIVPEHAYTEHYGDYPVCSGAWRFVEFQKGQQLILEPNPYYYGPTSQFQRLIILKFDEDASLAAAHSGQIDCVHIPTDFGKTEVKGMHLNSYNVLDTMIINLPVIPEQILPDGKKTGNDVTSDPAVRKALNIGIDRATIVKNAMEGFGRPAYHTGYSTLPWVPEKHIRDNRVREACEILEKAGWIDSDGDGIREKNGKKCEFTVTGRSNDTGRYNTVVAFAENAKALGINVIAKSMAWCDARQIARHTPTCWVSGGSSPNDLYRQCHSSFINVGKIGNPASYSCDEVDNYIDKALAATSQEEANVFWKKAEVRCSEDVPYINILTPKDLYFIRDGLVVPPLNKIPARNQGGSGLENINLWYMAD